MRKHAHERKLMTYVRRPSPYVRRPSRGLAAGRGMAHSKMQAHGRCCMLRFSNRQLTNILLAQVVLTTLPGAMAMAQTVANPICTDNTALFDPGNGGESRVPGGFSVSVLAKGLNMPTGIAFLGNKNKSQVFVLKSGHGLPSRCNEQDSFGGGAFDPANPFTPDILVFDQNGKKIAGPLGKP